MKFKSAKGFSLVELLIVIAIVAILATIAVPNFTKYRQNARLKEVAQDISNDMKFYKQKAMSENIRYLLYYPNWFNNNLCFIYKNHTTGSWSWDPLGSRKISDDNSVIISGTPDFVNNYIYSTWHASYLIFNPRGTTGGDGSLILTHIKNQSTATITTNIMGRVSVTYDLK